jgi:CubicO group peptidase (beta-lactamase class C family)
VDWLSLATLPGRPFKRLCAIPRDLDEVTSVAPEVPSRDIGLSHGAVHRVWMAVEDLYRTGLYPALQICIRREGQVVLHRALGHARGNSPDDPPSADKVLATPATPFLLYSASKAITAMVIHKLDERHALHLDDRVCDYIPGFAAHGKDWITLRHVLAHRAGIPNLPPHAMDLDLLTQPERVVDILSDAKPTSRPGQRLAYHAATGGFILGEVVKQATGQDIRSVLRKEILDPLGLRWMNYGVPAEHVDEVAEDAMTGLPVPPPIAQILRRALGAPIARVVEIANDARFRMGIVPSANIISTAEELCSFYQCLLELGELDGKRAFDPRTVRRAVSEQAYWELDLTLGVPLRYSHGFMLGGELMSLFGPGTPQAFGHLGFTNIFSWADPERRLAVALVTSGKPVLNVEAIRMLNVILAINSAFPKLDPRRP